MKDLSMHILDIVQNSIRANASKIEIEIIEDPVINELSISISDNGKGMDKETIAKVTDPFFTTRTTRKVGLGLSMFKQNAENTGGTFLIDSFPGKGTRVLAVFGFNHIDRPILGDLKGTLMVLLQEADNIDFIFKYLTPHGEFLMNTKEIKETLENIPINHPDVRLFLKEMIDGNLKQIQISE